MKDVFKGDKDKEVIRKEFLECLGKLEEEDWKILGWHHMHLQGIKWLSQPQKFGECEHYKIMKGWLATGDTVTPRETVWDTTINPPTFQRGIPNGGGIKSIFFAFWLAKGETICIACYGEHAFGKEIHQSIFGEARYSMVFRNWQDIFLGLLAKSNQ